MDVKWHATNADEVLTKLETGRSGLSDAEAAKRLDEQGPNELESKGKKSPVYIFLRQFLSPLIYILIAATLVSLAVQRFVDATVISIVIFLNAIIGFIQEVRAERAMEALMQMAAPKARVIRDGRTTEILARELVSGDVLALTAGDKVAADARLLESSELRVNEAALTGESMSADKAPGAVESDASLADRQNMVYMGTSVTHGKGKAVVVNTGMSTEMGRIAAGLMEVEQEKTPVQKSIALLGNYLIVVVFVVVSILAVVSVVRGLEWLEIFLLAVAAAVSAIPAGLPAVVTVVLAVGMRTMAARNAIIRRLVAVETLGSATIICSDKTGTLTLHEMTVRRLHVDGESIEVTGEGYRPAGEFRKNGQPTQIEDNDLLQLHLRIGVLCNDAYVVEDDGWSIIGDPTEGALLVAAAKAGLEKGDLEKASPRLYEIPFESEKQYMATLHQDAKAGETKVAKVAYVKGSVEKLLAMSRSLLTRSGVKELEQADEDAILEANTKMAQDALRVIATAYMELPEDVTTISDEQLKEHLVFVGVMGMEDPPREEAKQAVRQCKEAGIRVIMITGDNKLTAQAIASQLELPEGKTVSGRELELMSDEDLAKDIENISVFARIEPLHKLRIVNAFKKKGHTVAVTGDGVNDAPALKAASIGVAMGITGTDVAKEASDMVLADDNFASVVAAVDEGRATFNRLRNVIFYLLSTNFGELLALILSVGVVGLAPLLAVQILWVNLVTDASVAIPLGLEPKVGDELKQPPRHPKVGIVYPGLFLRVGFMALIMGTSLFAIFRWAEPRMDLDEARTLAFTSMVAFEWFRAFNARSDEHTAFAIGFFGNRWLLVGIGVAILLQIAVVYVPFLQVAFATVPLTLEQWGIATAAGLTVFVIEELRKVLFPTLFNLGKWRPAGQRQDAGS